MRIKYRKVTLVVLIVLLLGVFLWQNSEKSVVGGSAELSWNASPDAAGYKIYYGTDPRSGDCPPAGYEKNLDAGRATSYVLDKLTAGKTYFFSVTSYNEGKQESCFGEEVRKEIKNSVSGWLRDLFMK